MSSPLYLHYSQIDGQFFDPDTVSLRPGFAVKRNDTIVVRGQVCLSRKATISGTTLQASTHTIDLSGYTGTPVFGYKTNANYVLDASGDYTQAWGGYDTSDTSWHSLASGRFSMLIAPTGAVATYVPEIQLQTGASAALTIPVFRSQMQIIRDVAVGSEDTEPSGVSALSGTSTITSGNSSVDVTVTGLTVLTGAAVVSLVASSTFTLISYTIPNAGTLRIASAAAAPAAGWAVSYMVTAL